MLRETSVPAGGLTRRRFLSLAAWGAALVCVPGVAAAARQPLAPTRRLDFHNLHTEERLGVVYWENGAYVPAALEEIDAILRDHRTGEIRQMAPGLIDLVHALTARLGAAEPVRVISGYRSPATNAMLRGDDPRQVAENSLHLTGQALDFCLSGRSLRKVRDTALALQGGGVGYYPRSGFVHVDIGRVRRW
jgi:uncharacterized protein YcbK (DUF882 family)